MLLNANEQLIAAWTLLLLILGIFTGYWSWLFYRRLTDESDPTAAPFMLREIAYTNMFICFTVIRSLALFGYAAIHVAYIAWGAISTLMVVASYILLHRELGRIRQKGRRR